MTIQRYEQDAYLSTAAVHNGIAYLSGLTPDDLSQDIAAQMQNTLDNVDRALALVGSDKSSLLRVEIWIADMADFDAMNAPYMAWLDTNNIPARVCTQAVLWDPKCLVEIMVTAVIT